MRRKGRGGKGARRLRWSRGEEREGLEKKWRGEKLVGKVVVEKKWVL